MSPLRTAVFCAGLALLGVLSAPIAVASIDGIATESTDASIEGTPVRVTRVYALASSAADRVRSVDAYFLGGSATFHHRDAVSEGEFSTVVGSWKPALSILGGNLDSFVTIGAPINASNLTAEAGGWGTDGFNRPDFPQGAEINAHCSWTTFNPNAGGPDASGRVLVAQFVTDRDDVALLAITARGASATQAAWGTVLLSPDLCPDAAKSAPGQCGCGEADTDSDDDGAADCVDAPTTPVAMPSPRAANKVNPGLFGASISASGDRIAVGAPSSLYLGWLGRGAVLVFKRDKQGWKQEQAIVAPLELGLDPTASDGFGSSVAFGGDTLFVGAPSRRVAYGSPITRGTVYAFRFDVAQGRWVAGQQITSPRQDNAIRSSFGSRIVFAGGRLFVSDPSDATLAASMGSAGMGAVSVLEADGDGLWTERAAVVNPAQDPQNQFGFSLSLAATDDELAVGAPGLVQGHAGIVRIFRRNAQGGWDLAQTMLHPTGNTVASGFGTSVAMDAHTLAIAAYRLTVAQADGLPLPPLDTTGAQLYERGADGLWIPTQLLVPAEWAAQHVGRLDPFPRLALDGDRLAFSVESGAQCYLYRRTDSAEWIQHAKAQYSPAIYLTQPSAVAFVGSSVVSAFGTPNPRADGSLVADDIGIPSGN